MVTTEMPQTVYKICEQAEWSQAERQGRYDGSTVDLNDGYIHLSTRDQLAETAAKHFAGRRDLVLIAFSPTELSQGLRWEPARGGALFPHHYGSINPDWARRIWPLRNGADKGPVIPDGEL